MQVKLAYVLMYSLEVDLLGNFPKFVPISDILMINSYIANLNIINAHVFVIN